MLCGERDAFCSEIHTKLWVIKLRRVRWAGHVAHMGERRGTYRVLVGNPRERDHSENLGIDGRIVLKWFFKK